MSLEAGLLSLEAAAVLPGDRVYDAGYYAPDKWVLVKSVKVEVDAVWIDMGYVTFVKHPREGVSVMRSIRPDQEAPRLTQVETGNAEPDLWMDQYKRAYWINGSRVTAEQYDASDEPDVIKRISDREAMRAVVVRNDLSVLVVAASGNRWEFNPRRTNEQLREFMSPGSTTREPK